MAEDAAQRLGVSRSELYRRALREFLAEHDVRAVIGSLSRQAGNCGAVVEAEAVERREECYA